MCVTYTDVPDDAVPIVVSYCLNNGLASTHPRFLRHETKHAQALLSPGSLMKPLPQRLFIEYLENRTIPSASPWLNPGDLTISFVPDGTATGAGEAT